MPGSIGLGKGGPTALLYEADENIQRVPIILLAN